MKTKSLFSLLLITVILLGSIVPSSNVLAATLPGNGTEESPYLISTIADFNQIAQDLNAHYLLVNDLDFQNVKRLPMGEFKGVLDGGNHTISNLEIESVHIHQFYIGIFSKMTNAKVQNLIVENPTATKQPHCFYVGIFAGSAVNSTFINCKIIDPIIESAGTSGSFCGEAINSNFINCYSEDGVIDSSYNVGGLVGSSSNIYLSQCYSTTDVISDSYGIGGLIGCAFGTTTILESFAASSIHGTTDVGGLVGVLYNNPTCTISDSYARCRLTTLYSAPDYPSARGEVGGLIGMKPEENNMMSPNDPPQVITINISNSYFIGTFKGTLVYPLSAIGTITSSYFDKTVARIDEPVSQACTTEEMKSQSTYVDWDFDNIWYITENMDYPQLRFYMNH